MDSFSSTTAAVAVGGVGGNVGVGGVATTVTPLLPPPSSHNTSPRIIPATSTSVSSSTFPTTNTSNNSINTSITTSSQVSMEEQKKKLEKKFMENRPQLAFAKLVGKLVDNVPFECLITQLPAELGRGPITSTSVGGRVCLGEQKAISRQHAKITWNAEKNEYELTCLGKNGMFAAGKLVSKDQTIELKSKMPLKIGGARIYFLKALKSPCSNLSGFKMLYKLYHQKHLASGSSVTCEEIIQQILEMFPKSEQDLGGKQNLTEFITQYVQVDKEHFVEEIDSNGIKRYRMVAQGQQEETTTTGNSTKKRPPTLSNSHPNPIAVNSSVDVSKKQKV